ncbi:quinon protein alcohol dehydrogenase-like superfamily [Nemania sp. FL0916]|nr:quinon protein alcohol dehydrogenase-like superfamily [Nemania sp. FL0916]
MRPSIPPHGSPSFELDCLVAAAAAAAVVVEDVSYPTGAVGSTTSALPPCLSLSAHLEPSSPLHVPLHAQNHHNSAIQGVDDADTIDEEGDSDHGTLDVEEGGAFLYDINMEETDDQAAAPPLQTIPPAPAAGNPPTALQQVPDQQDVPDPALDELDPHPDFVTNANPGMLMPDNHNCFNFLRDWQWRKSHNQLRDIRGIPRNEDSMADLERHRITYENLRGDECDMQGINWQHLEVSRTSARKCRAKTFRSYTNIVGSDVWKPSNPDRLLTRHENYFRFRNMDLRTDVSLLHFQLRNVMGCASRTAVYYPSTNGTVRALDPTTGLVKTAMKFRNTDDAAVSTLAAEEGILATGSFYGTYRYRRIEAEDESCCYDGRLTDHGSGITNHVQISSSRRSSVPLAAYASNDYRFRILDLARNQIIHEERHKYALNCTALSPDKSLRVAVGDLQQVLIKEADTGKTLVKLNGHRDFGFACDWAPNGWTVATGNQDKTIRIWDARKWEDSSGKSVCVGVIRSEMAGVRTLRFSPLGSGKRLLLAAEEADVVNIIDAQTFNSKQTIDILGELAGVSFTSGGQEVVALSSDPIRGGVLCLERCDHGAENAFDYTSKQDSQDWWHTPGYDWLPTPQQVVEHPNTQVSLTEKRRQAAMAEEWFY